MSKTWSTNFYQVKLSPLKEKLIESYVLNVEALMVKI